MTKSKSINGARESAQGSSTKTFDDYGLTGPSLIPSITTDAQPSLIMQTTAGDGSVINETTSKAFNDLLGSTALGATTVGGEKRQVSPNLSLESVMIGQPEQLDLSTTYVDKSKMTISIANPDLSAGLQARYLGATALKDERLTGNITALGGYPIDPIVYSGFKGKSTPLLGTFSAGTEDHFSGEVVISDVFDTKAPECRGFIDGDTRKLTMQIATGSFYSLNIENTPFTDAIEKTLTYEGLTDTSIVSSFPLAQTGSIHNEALLPNERFATGGFTYDISQYGPDTFGMDSITFGGWMK